MQLTKHEALPMQVPAQAFQLEQSNFPCRWQNAGLAWG